MIGFDMFCSQVNELSLVGCSRMWFGRFLLNFEKLDAYLYDLELQHIKVASCIL